MLKKVVILSLFMTAYVVALEDNDPRQKRNLPVQQYLDLVKQKFSSSLDVELEPYLERPAKPLVDLTVVFEKAGIQWYLKPLQGNFSVFFKESKCQTFFTCFNTFRQDKEKIINFLERYVVLDEINSILFDLPPFFVSKNKDLADTTLLFQSDSSSPAA